MMIDSKPIFFILLLCISTSFKLCCSSILCPEVEKQALVKFKQSLEDPSGMLSSWNISSEENCCMWKGVVCSNLTGHVHQLRLQNLDYYESDGLSGELNPSILNLKELKYLDLSHNVFGVVIPSFVGLLTSLEYLDLSFSAFHGRIPHNIGNLSNLHTLNLEGNLAVDINDPAKLDADNMEWVSGLSRLEYLNMNQVNLSKTANWDQVINKLSSLVELHLSGCGLKSAAPLKHVNSTSLTILDLSGNVFDSSSMPRWIFQLPNLVFFDGRGSSFGGPIPSISNTTKLKFIDVYLNNLNSSIPDWLYFCKDLEYVSMSKNFLHDKISDSIGNLTSLRTLDLSVNGLSGDIPRGIASLCKMDKLDLSENKLGGEVSEAFGSMSDCFLEAVTSLALNDNQLSGHLTPQFGEFKRLQILDLRDNSISGEIPTNVGKLSGLNVLGLSNNKLSGNLPDSMGQLLNLTVLYIEDNMLEGMVTETHFSNLSNLTDLFGSGNHLSLKISSNWVPPFTLNTLELGSWNLGPGNIPLWIQTQNLIGLDLSNTGVSGKIPTWLWEIRNLNLSHNNLHGQIPYITGPSAVYLSYNRFSGSLPRVADTVFELDLSNNSFTGGMSHFLCDTTYQTYQLEVLYLGGNQLSGELPDCLMKWPSLFLLNLAENNMSGKIPSSVGFLANLFAFNLHGNKFSGQIPFSLHNCTNLLKLDLGANAFSGNISASMVTSLKFLILRSNKLSGKIPLDICHLNALQILDLSDNAFSGLIPKCVNNFTAMATKRSLDEVRELIYSQKFMESASVSTKGRLYAYNTILSLVTNIDLSNNNFSGDIPKELTRLVELRSLNLSRNRLTGSLPDRMGDMKQMESLDLSRNSLLGEIPNSFTLMFSLSYLDLSFNNLTGKIPSSTQLLSMDASSFVGNHLCGPPLPNNCSNGDPFPSVDAKNVEGGESKIEWLYVFLSLGYAVGLSACCTALVLKKSWRDAYFGFVEFIWNKLYVYLCIKWTGLTTT